MNLSSYNRLESRAVFTSKYGPVQIDGRLESSDFCAGGPVEMELAVTNQGSSRLLYFIGQARRRPAYLKFSAQLQKPGIDLRDPYPSLPLEPEGPIASIPLRPGESYSRTIILNQYLSLEDTRSVLAPSQHAVLHIHYRVLVGISGEQNVSLPGLEPVEGELQAGLTRDDDRLRREIATLAGKLLDDSNPISSDPVGRIHAITVLTSLRVQEVVPYLQRFDSYPNVDVRNMAQQALSEMKK